MYPNECRLRNLTYATNIFCDIDVDYIIRTTGEKVVTKTYEKINIGKIPIMLQSKMCALNGFTVDYTPDGSYSTYNDDGGEGDEDQSNIFEKVPAAIGVAASNRDGIGMSDFSSRGDMSDRDTWPDVTAPGVDIWSAAARADAFGFVEVQEAGGRRLHCANLYFFECCEIW